MTVTVLEYCNQQKGGFYRLLSDTLSIDFPAREFHECN